MPITKHQLLRWSEPHPLDRNGRYFRPLVCKGRLEDINTLVVGQNPATPISREDVPTIKAYAGLLQANYARLLAIFTLVRSKAGKAPVSKTRGRIDDFCEQLCPQPAWGVGETNINTFPTWEPEELAQHPRPVVQQGEQVFEKVMLAVSPRIVVLHGDEALIGFRTLAKRHQWLGDWNEDVLKAHFRQRKVSGPVARLNVGDSPVTIFACEHLRFFSIRPKAKHKHGWMRLISAIQKELQS